MSANGNRVGWRFGRGPFELVLRDPIENSELTWVGKPLKNPLTPNEMRLLVAIVQGMGQIVPEDELIKATFGDAAADHHDFAMVLASLKKKLPEEIFGTE